MRILLVSLHFSEYSYLLSRELSKDNDVLLVLSQRNSDAELAGLNIEQTETLELVYLPHEKNLSSLVGNVVRIVQLTKAFVPDVIHFQEVPVEYQTVALLLLKRFPMVLTVHDPSPHAGSGKKAFSGLGRRRGFYVRLQRRLASAIITHGLVLRRMLVERSYDSRLVFDIPHGPLGLLQPKRAVRIQKNIKFSYLFFGRMEAYKGLKLFVAAIEELHKEGLDVLGIIAGRGPELDNIKDTLSGRSCFLVKESYLTPYEMAETFDNANVVVLPYVEGTQSGVAALAAGRGKACIISGVGSLPEMVIDGKTGIVVEPNCLSSLTKAMRYLYLNRKECDEMGRAAAVFGESMISWDLIAKKTVRVYGHAINSGRK